MKILVVDDNPENLYMLASLLKGGGYEAVTACDGVEALEKLKDGGFEMIISDILMPRMDGYGLCRACKKDEGLAGIPFLLYTAVYTNREDEEFAKKLGAARYIVKPIEPVELLKIIEEVFNEYMQGKAALPGGLAGDEELYLAEYSGRLVNQLEKKVRELENEIAARKSVEQALKKSEEKFRNLVETTNDFVWEVDRSAVYTYVSPRISEILGYRADEVLGKTPFDLMPANEARRVAALFKGIAASGRPFTMLENVNLHRDGRFLVLESSGMPVFDEGGSLIGYRGIDRDITNRKKIEDENRRLVHDLKERIKELTAIHRTAILLQDYKLSPDVILKNMATFLPYAWQYPDIAAARVSYGELESSTWNYADSKWKQDVEFKTSDGKTGRIELVYLEERAREVEGPFLKEERNLLNSLAEMLRSYFELRYGNAELEFKNTLLSTQQEVSIDGILVVDAAGKMISFNSRFADMWGIGVDIIESRSDERALQSVLDKLKDPEGFIKRVRHLYEHRGETSKDEIELKDGRVFDRYSASMFANNEYYGRVWFFRDITERKRIEGQLKENEAYVRQLIEQSPVALLVDEGVGDEEKILIMNRRFTQLFGYTIDDVPDVRHWWPLAYPDEKYRDEVSVEWTKRVEGAIRTQTEIEPMEVTVACRDKSTRFVRVGLASIGSRNIVTFEDLTERKANEEALKDSIERFGSITSAAMDAIILVDDEGRVIFWNDKAVAMFGYTREEAVGKDLHILIAPERYIADYRMGYDVFKKTGKGAAIGAVQELDARRKDGSEFPVELSVAAVMLKGKWNSVGIIRDITARRKAEETLSGHYKFLQALIDTMPNPVFYKDVSGVYLGCNRAFEALLGKTKTDIVGKTVYDIMKKDEADKYTAWDRALFKKPGVQSYETTVVNADGAMRYLMANRAAYARADGSVGGLVGILVDITDRLDAERKIKEEMEITANLLMIARAASTTSDIDKLMESVISCVHRIFACDISLSYLWDGERMEFVPSHAEGLTPGLASRFRGDPLGANIRFIIDAFTSKKSLAVQSPLYGPDAASGQDRPLKWLENTKQMLVVPLMGRAGRPGLLLLAYRHDREFTERDYRVLDGISHQVANALEEAKLYADSINKTLELSHNIEAIQVMHELDRSILSTLDRNELLDTAVGLIDRVVPCDHVSAFLVNREKGELEAVAGNLAEIAKGSRVPFGDTLAAEIMDTGRPQIIPDLAKIKKLPLFDARLLEKGCRSSIRVPLTVKGDVAAVLFIGSNRKAVFTPEDLSMVEKLASQICVALENSRLLTDLNDLFIGIVKSLSEAIDAKSPWTRGHSERVTKFAVQTARVMGMDERNIKTLEIAGLLHDIGKIGTYENILEKPGKLLDDELRLMQQHPGKGAEILAPIKQLKDVMPAIKYHHECYDGTGYPDGLKGEVIPLMARILTVADSVDAMGADRPYRKGRPMDEIVKELKRCSGTQFDPAVVKAFLETLEGR